MGKYKLSKEATEDLYNIWEYTVDTWSETQADKYYSTLVSAFKKLASNPMIQGKSYDSVMQGLRGLHVGKHIVFYMHHSEHGVLIIRILHESMDFAQHFCRKDLKH